MEEICIRCNENEITNYKRKLCSKCYSYLYRKNQLEEYPMTRGMFTIENYGVGFVEDMQKLVSDYDTTLADVGRKYSLSRERIRQIFELFYGFKYTVVKNQAADQAHENKKVEQIKRADPRNKVLRYKVGSLVGKGAASEKKVFDICANLGYEIKPTGGTEIDLLINGYKVEVKSSYLARKTNPKSNHEYFHFQIRPGQKNADFWVLHAVPINTFFIIPKDKFLKGSHVFVNSNSKHTPPKGKLDYYDYAEKWSLLKRKSEEIIFSKELVANN